MNDRKIEQRQLPRRLSIWFAAMPSDVRKVFDLPEDKTFVLGAAPPY